MTSPELEQLASLGKLTRTPATAREVAQLLQTAHARLVDARNATLAPESRFDLAYAAAHGFALAALRRQGYRSANRYLVFQLLEHTAAIPASQWRVLAKAHETRNLIEYEGEGMVDGRLLTDLISATTMIEQVVVNATMQKPEP